MCYFLLQRKPECKYLYDKKPSVMTNDMNLLAYFKNTFTRHFTLIYQIFVESFVRLTVFFFYNIQIRIIHGKRLGNLILLFSR